jgi:hypothetical protein
MLSKSPKVLRAVDVFTPAGFMEFAIPPGRCDSATQKGHDARAERLKVGRCQPPIPIKVTPLSPSVLRADERK